MTPVQIAYLQTLEPVPDHWGGLGATHLHPDPRDYDIRILPGVAELLVAGLPDSVDLTGFIRGPVLNQGQEGACVAYSTAHLGSIDDVIETGTWPAIDAETMYHRAGGTGQNGVDSRLVLQQALDSGMPAVGGPVKVISSYAFVPQQPGVFSQTIMAALAAGYPVVLALLLPSDFSSWQAGHGAKTSGYHQICLIGYYTDKATGMVYFLFLNSWGAGFGRNGVGSILISYLEADNLQSDYCFAYTAAPSVTPAPKPDPVPPVPIPIPTPTPVPPSVVLTGRLTGMAASTVRVGQSLAITTEVGNGDLLVTLIAGPLPDPQPKPDPRPDPKPDPAPGGLTVQVYAKPYSAGRAGAWAYIFDPAGKPVAANLTGEANNLTLEPRNGVSQTSWSVVGAQPARPLTITVHAQASDGRTGVGGITLL